MHADLEVKPQQLPLLHGLAKAQLESLEFSDFCKFLEQQAYAICKGVEAYLTTQFGFYFLDPSARALMSALELNQMISWSSATLDTLAMHDLHLLEQCCHDLWNHYGRCIDYCQAKYVLESGASMPLSDALFLPSLAFVGDLLVRATLKSTKELDATGCSSRINLLDQAFIKVSSISKKPHGQSARLLEVIGKEQKRLEDTLHGTIDDAMGILKQRIETCGALCDNLDLGKKISRKVQSEILISTERPESVAFQNEWEQLRAWCKASRIPSKMCRMYFARTWNGFTRQSLGRKLQPNTIWILRT